jgi:Rab-like protein 3
MAYSHSTGPSVSDKVRILVVGDMSVGKTSLVHLICEGKVLSNPYWTIGCKTEVKLHEYNKREFFIEFLDVGGSPKHENSRSIYYTQVNGLILVHDVTNRKSYTNLKKWIKEILNQISPSDTHKWSLKNEKQILELQHEDTNVYPIPILVLANKFDCVRSYSDTNYLNNDDLGRDSVFVSALDASCFTPNSPSGTRLDAFLSRVISNTLAPRPKTFTKISTNVGSMSPESRPRATSVDRLQQQQQLQQQMQQLQFQQLQQQQQRNTKLDSSVSVNVGGVKRKDLDFLRKSGNVVYSSDEESPNYPVAEASLLDTYKES